MTSTTDELTQDYLERLARVQPSDLPDDLDLFYEQTATRGIRLNKAAYSLKHPEQRELFERDEEAWMEQFDLTDEEKDLMRRRDWIGLWRGGMTIYVMVKLSGVTGTALPEIGKQMRESAVWQELLAGSERHTRLRWSTCTTPATRRGATTSGSRCSGPSRRSRSGSRSFVPTGSS